MSAEIPKPPVPTPEPAPSETGNLPPSPDDILLDLIEQEGSERVLGAVIAGSRRGTREKIQPPLNPEEAHDVLKGYAEIVVDKALDLIDDLKEAEAAGTLLPEYRVTVMKKPGEPVNRIRRMGRFIMDREDPYHDRDPEIEAKGWLMSSAYVRKALGRAVILTEDGRLILSRAEWDTREDRLPEEKKKELRAKGKLDGRKATIREGFDMNSYYLHDSFKEVRGYVDTHYGIPRAVAQDRVKRGTPEAYVAANLDAIEASIDYLAGILDAQPKN